MKLRVGRGQSTQQRPENEVEDSSIGGGSDSPTGGLFRTLHADDRITETSLTRAKIHNKTQAEDDEGAVLDSPLSPSMLDAAIASGPEPDDRARSILSLLLRPQSRELLERVLSTDDAKAQQERLGPVLLSSHDALWTFARLVVVGALAVSDGRLVTTPFTNRIVRVVGETSKA